MASEASMRALFANIADRYDPMNRVMSLGFDLSWRRRAARTLMRGLRQSTAIDCNRSPSTAPELLDLACGTGDSALAMASLGGRVTGLDLSPEMLAVAADKAKRQGEAVSRRLHLVCGSAMELPFGEGAFDGAMCAFGFRNFPEIRRPLEELRRVVRPGGRLCVLEFFTPRCALARALSSLWLTLAGRLAGASRRKDYAHLRDSIAAMGPAGRFVETAESCGWRLRESRRFFPACTMLLFG